MLAVVVPRRVLVGLIVTGGLALPASAATPRTVKARGTLPGGECTAGSAGCGGLPPSVGTYRDRAGSVDVVFTLAKRTGSSKLVIRNFRFANRCRHGRTRVTHEISVGPQYRFRFSSRDGITIRGSFVLGFTGGFFFGPSGSSGFAVGTVRFRSAGCDSGAISFSATR